MINDISAGLFDPKMPKTIAQLQVPVVLMHMQGKPADMQIKPEYTDVLNEVMNFLQERVSDYNDLGVKDIIIDPGIGFGKSVQHNYRLIAELQFFDALNCPILVGVSRKSLINKLLNIQPEQALNGTTAVHMLALERGANLLRVHDVQAAKEAIAIFNACRNSVQ